MRSPSIAIFTCKDDFHALVIQHEVERTFGITCHVVETDEMAGSPAFSWRSDPGHETLLLTRTGSTLALSEVDAIWWRRPNSAQRLSSEVDDEAEADLIDQDSKAALLGGCMTDFHGEWISDPLATFRAENKLVQLRAAREVGLRVPATLVSQRPPAIREFCASSERTIIKPVRGTQKKMLPTQFVGRDGLKSDAALSAAPAIYQEYIPGDRHLRVQCFGDQVYGMELETDRLDWRTDLRIPVHAWQPPAPTKALLISMLEALDLQMGVFDLKLDPAGDPVFLEVNPQGQFLFVQGMSGLDLSGTFAKFLYETAERHRRRQPATG